MALIKGERYRCPKIDCCCEIEVIRNSGTGGGHEKPICCCGKQMELAKAEYRTPLLISLPKWPDGREASANGATKKTKEKGPSAIQIGARPCF